MAHVAFPRPVGSKPELARYRLVQTLLDVVYPLGEPIVNQWFRPAASVTYLRRGSPSYYCLDGPP